MTIFGGGSRPLADDQKVGLLIEEKYLAISAHFSVKGRGLRYHDEAARC